MVMSRPKPPIIEGDPPEFHIERFQNGFSLLHWSNCEPQKTPRTLGKFTKLSGFPFHAVPLCSTCRQQRPLSSELMTYYAWTEANPIIRLKTRIATGPRNPLADL